MNYLDFLDFFFLFLDFFFCCDLVGDGEVEEDSGAALLPWRMAVRTAALVASLSVDSSLMVL